MTEGKETTFISIGSAKPASAQANLIERSGCSDIQEAIEMGKKYGLTPDDLSKKTRDEVVNVMASAKEVGGQAAQRPPSEPQK